MKITVVVDLSEFYTEEDGQSFSNEIKNEIASRVKTQVWKDFQDLALEELKLLVNAEFTKVKEMNLNKIVEDIFANEKLKKNQNSTEMISVKDYITEKIKNDYFSERNNAEAIFKNLISNFENKFNLELKNTSDALGKELKQRYDLLFASQIVTKLNEQGLLREDVAKILLGSGDESKE